MKEIVFDVQTANSQIQDLEEIAANLEKIAAGKLSDTIEQLGSAWKGAGSGRILKKAEQLQAEVKTAAGLAEESAEAYRTAVNKVRSLEQAGSVKFQT